MEDLRKAFGDRVAALRDARGLSQEQLAERAGLHWTYVSGVERGRRAPSLDVVGRIATGLGVTIAELCAPLSGTYQPHYRRSHRLSPERAPVTRPRRRS